MADYILPNAADAPPPGADLQHVFADQGFPSPDQLVERLMEGWASRKGRLNPDEAARFFILSADEVRPVLTILANRFFSELSQLAQFRDPLLVRAGLRVLERREDSPQENLQELLREHFSEFCRQTARLFTRDDRPRRTFELSCTRRQESVRVEMLYEDVRNFRKVFLAGQAGAGKTEALDRMFAGICNDRAAAGSILPILLDAAKLSPLSDEVLRAEDDPASFEPVWDKVLSFAIPAISAEAVGHLGARSIPTIIIDQVNEVPSVEVAKAIVRIVAEFARRRFPRTTYLIVAGRHAPSELTPDWTISQIDPLSENTSKTLIDENFGGGAYDALTTNDKELLTIPYYLDLVLQSGSPQIGTAANAIERFLREQLDFTEDQLDSIASAAFTAYSKYRSTLFDREVFGEAQNGHTVQRLFQATILEERANLVRFRHQLHHDYLAARHLAKSKDWNSPAFDAVSLRANSFDAICMTLEQLARPEDGDEFLRALYDWNLTAATIALSRTQRLGKKPFTTEMEVALFALLSEKLFDGVEATRARAKEFFLGLPLEAGKQIAACQSPECVFEIVNKVDSQSSWFLVWRRLFTAQQSFTESELSGIGGADSIVGWTIANAVRRININDAEQRQLREVYRAHLPKTSRPAREVTRAAAVATIYGDTETHLRATIRWRVVHALGKYATASNVQLLFDALDNDPYHWTRYGTGRSLVEIAALTEDDGLRAEVISGLTLRVPGLIEQQAETRHVIDEIGRALQYRGAKKDWKTDVAPLIDAFSKAPDSQIAESWQRRREDLAQWNTVPEKN